MVEPLPSAIPIALQSSQVRTPLKESLASRDHDVKAIIEKFNRLNPYDPELVPNLLKLEYEEVSRRFDAGQYQRSGTCSLREMIETDYGS